MRDKLTGAERTVSEVSSTRTLSPHLLLARLVDHAGLPLLIGMHPSSLAPEAGHDTLDFIRTELGLAKTATPDELRAGDRPTTLIDIWQEMAAPPSCVSAESLTRWTNHVPSP